METVVSASSSAEDASDAKRFAKGVTNSLHLEARSLSDYAVGLGAAQDKKFFRRVSYRRHAHPSSPAACNPLRALPNKYTASNTTCFTNLTRAAYVQAI
eukprot:6199995-Pleurochrysis_carterae.AAC.3